MNANIIIIQSEWVLVISESSHKKLTKVYGTVYQHTVFMFMKAIFIITESSILDDILTTIYGQDSDHQILTYVNKKVNY